METTQNSADAKYVAQRICFQNGERHSVLKGPNGLPVHEVTLHLGNYRRNGRAANTIHSVCTALALLYRELHAMQVKLIDRLEAGKFLSTTELDRLAAVAQYRMDDLAEDASGSDNSSVIKLAKVAMRILGRNFLSGADTEYDLARGMVRLMFPTGDCEKTQLLYWAGDAPIISERLLRPSDRRDTAARVIVTVNGTRLRALLDTGAPVTTLLRSAAKRAGIEEKDMTPAGRTGGAGVGKVRAWTATVASFEFGGEKILNNQFVIDEAESQDHDMIIGLDYFLSHRIYVSRLQKQVSATWNGGAVFARDGQVGEADARHAAAPAELAADDAEGLAVRAAAAVLRGDHAGALRDLDRACEIAPTVARHFMARSQAKLSLRQPREALKDLDEALRLQPDLGEARLSRARLRLGFADRAGAEADLRELDGSQNPSSHLRAGMAGVYAQLDRAPEALRQWELWIPTHVDDNALPGILNQRCWLRARLNIDLPEALKDCKQAVSKDGGEPGYRNSLGWLYLRMGEASSARKALDASIEMKPFAWSLYGRAVALQQLGKAELAQRDLEAARKLNPKIDAEVRRAGFEALLAAPPA